MNEKMNDYAIPSRLNEADAPLMAGTINDTINDTNNKIRNISIQQLNRGYLVNVGCHNFAFSTDTELISLLSQYIANPNQTEKKWFDGKLF